MIEYAIDCIGVTEKVVKDIVGDDNLICERSCKKKRNDNDQRYFR
jgi:hypothetical protein